MILMKKHIQDAVLYLFDEQVRLTGVTEYGLRWADLTSGKIAPPPEGARFDIAFEGEVAGDRLNGRIRGMDYLEVRADGRFMLDIRATIITDDGELIALREDGVLTPSPGAPTASLHLNMTFTTHSPRYAWLNRQQVWAIGQADMVRGAVTVRAYTGAPVISSAPTSPLQQAGQRITDKG